MVHLSPYPGANYHGGLDTIQLEGAMVYLSPSSGANGYGVEIILLRALSADRLM